MKKKKKKKKKNGTKNCTFATMSLTLLQQLVVPCKTHRHQKITEIKNSYTHWLCNMFTGISAQRRYIHIHTIAFEIGTQQTGKRPATCDRERDSHSKRYEKKKLLRAYVRWKENKIKQMTRVCVCVQVSCDLFTLIPHNKSCFVIGIQIIGSLSSHIAHSYTINRNYYN